MKIRFLTPFLFLISLNINSLGQISHGGVPASFSALKRAKFEIPVIDMTPVNNEELVREEKSASRQARLKPYVFARSFDVDIDPSNSGIWEKIGSQKIWRVGIRSRGAYSLNLIFDKMILPPGGSLFIYSADRSKVKGAYTSKNEQSSGYFTFYPVPGDEIIVEYNDPPTKAGVNSGANLQIHILKVNHDYKNVFGTRPLGEAGLCNRDVYCPDVIQYSKEKQAVVDLIVAGRELCTGMMLNNTSQDKTPYMMTAGHCIMDSLDAQQTLVCFNYESPYCANGKSSLNGYVDQTLNGSNLKARSDSLDFALVELENVPPPEFRPYYAGWNKSAAVPSSTFAIHHPKGDVKKVGYDQNAPTVSSFSSDFLSNAFWQIGKWEAGTTEAGSSGGPLFNDKKLVIGSLTGGTSTCSDPTDDLFAMFSKQWNHYSSPSQQLKTWLDPNNTGINELSSLNPYDTIVACDLFSNLTTGETYTLQKFGSSSGGFLAGHNYLKITNYAEKFIQTKQTLLSAVSLGIAKDVSGAENQNSIIKLQVFKEDTIYGLPGDELLSMNLPLNLLSPDQMNFIILDNPMIIKGNYFIGYEINYSNATDTFAVYNTPDRKNISKNKAYAKENGYWKPLYSIPEIGISSSLLINSHGCESTFSTIVNPPPGNEVNKFQVLYPQSGISNYVYLKNNGVEEYVRITLYDIMGKKLFILDQMVTDVPRIISMGNYSSGVYFMTIQSQNGVQAIKIRINKGG
jgi:lysyl endopeptidase